MGRYALVPQKDDYEGALTSVLEAFSKSGVSLKECLDTDAAALGGTDMKYFPTSAFGTVPTYAIFIRHLQRLPSAVKDDFNEAVAEIESSRYLGRMSDIAENGDMEDARETRRFNLLDRVNKVYERKLNRLDLRRKNRGDDQRAGADLAMRIIGALKDSDLLKLKGDVEAIDAEYKEVVDGRQRD